MDESEAGSSSARSFSPDLLQTLVQQEIQVAMNRRQSKTQRLAEMVKKLESEFDYSRPVMKLEARMNMLARRVEVAIAAMLQSEKRETESGADELGTGPVGGKDPESQTDDKSLISQELIHGAFRAMETNKESLKRIRDESEASVEVPQVKQPRLQCAPTVPGMQTEIKAEMDAPPVTPKPEPQEVQLSLPGCESINTLQQGECQFPPLPDTPFPSSISANALSFSIPQRVSVHLALIKQPARLSVLWKVDRVDPEAAPVDSYRILMTMEMVKGSGIFWDWKVLHEVKAIALPMCVLIAKYKPGHKVCVAVVGKDIYGRFGPYSEVVNAVVPEAP